jgi:hypothetical protein
MNKQLPGKRTVVTEERCAMTGEITRRDFLNGAASAAAALLASPIARADDARLERLSPPNRALAQQMLAGVARWDQKYRERAAALNGGPSRDAERHRRGRSAPRRDAQALAYRPAVRRSLCEQGGALRSRFIVQHAADDQVLTGRIPHR